jgi:hypothetical protein
MKQTYQKTGQITRKLRHPEQMPHEIQAFRSDLGSAVFHFSEPIWGLDRYKQPI